jgi:hypothetical protein
MPKGTETEISVAGSSTTSTQTEVQMQVLCLMLEFGSATQKSNAIKEIECIAKVGASKRKDSTEAVDPIVEVESKDENSEQK